MLIICHLYLHTYYTLIYVIFLFYHRIVPVTRVIKINNILYSHATQQNYGTRMQWQWNFGMYCKTDGGVLERRFFKVKKKIKKL